MTEQQIRIFTTSDGQAQLEVALDRETVWLSQAQMGQLFDTTPENVLMHLKNVFRDEELVYLATHSITYNGTFFRHSALLFLDIGPLCLRKSALIGEKMHSP